MRHEHRCFPWSLILLLLLLLAGCGPASVEDSGLVSPTDTLSGAEVPATQTRLPSPTAKPLSTEAPISETPVSVVEQRIIELEWPPTMRLGDSDIVRVSLIPSDLGHIPQVEFEDHELDLESEEIPYRDGFDAFAIARMNAAGIAFEPAGDQEQKLVQGQVLNWRWSILPERAGIHRLSLEVRIRWEPLGEGRIEEVSIWDSGLEVRVSAPLGMAAPQARALGVLGIFLGSVMAIPLAEFVARRRFAISRAHRIRRLKPNTDTRLDVASGAHISSEDRLLLQALYNRYQRVTIERRYSSGYSGARTFLVQPTRRDGRTDAFAIVKIGSQREIRSEYRNYETFVRHTLPPVTSRVQGPPVIVDPLPDAALEYTFVGMPGATPTSLKSYVLSKQPGEFKDLIGKGLFTTFGAGWWMQRGPYAFRMGREYDRLLPVHVVLERTRERSGERRLTGERAEIDDLIAGQVVRLENAVVSEVRPQRSTATFSWQREDHLPPVRVRFVNIDPKPFDQGSTIRTAFGRVLSSREDLLRDEAEKCFPGMRFEDASLELYGRGVDNPLFHLDNILQSHQAGTRSIIHGDLNLENVLVGPGDLIWLIDFASTREGHTLFDFARLEAELTTQAISEIFLRHGLGPESFFTVLDALEEDRSPEEFALGFAYELLDAVRSVARKLLFDPGKKDELQLSLFLAYLGTMKFSNLDEFPHAPLPKTLAFLAAGHLLTRYLNPN